MGIIPAYAGSTAAMSGRGRCRRDHPRIRGEHVEFSLEPVPGRGSSPHTRGAPSGRPSGCGTRSDHPRIRGEHPPSALRSSIMVGSSPHTRGARLLEEVPDRHGQDHPRIRGEHRVEPHQPLAPGGSSPHTRGARAFTTVSRMMPRIIPAYAGSTEGRRRRRLRGTDHPRIRGEHIPELKM